MCDHQEPGPLPFSLEPELTPPRLPGQVIARRDTEELHSALGADLLIHAQNCARTFGDFHLALSGGSTPLPFYERLMIDPAFRAFPWNRTHLWIVDERRVPEDDPRCNFKHIREIIGDHAGIPHEQVHPMHAHLDDADIAYERLLRETLGWRERGHDRLDFVLLGMGDDAHTASLFPHSPALRESQRLVVANAGPTVTPPDRITMTYPLINASRFIGVLVTGKAKRDTIARLARNNPKGNPAELPILGIAPVGGTLRWYLDAAACPAND